MSKKGVILMNLGSPDSTSRSDVKKYLDEFLMDERVIDKPYWWRLLLVKCIITPFRAAKSAEAYKTIWWKEGSPLIVLTEKLQQALQQKIDLPIAVSMRYGKPHPQTAYEQLLEKEPDLEEVILVPLYPHYAMSSWETAVAYMKKIHARRQYPFTLKTVPPFFEHPAYIRAMAATMRPYLQEPFDQLLFSYHGIPERHIYKADATNSAHDLNSDTHCCQDLQAQATCYRHQAIRTSQLIAGQLGLSSDQWRISYQSRLGRDPWLLPSTQERLPNLPTEGVKKLKVVCPSFVSDCLETLEEIEERGKEDFMTHGGTSYEYIPCMNTNAVWVDALAELIQDAQSAPFENSHTINF